MKLYTEEQVKQILLKSKETGLTVEYLILVNPPIELPSNEEIEKLSKNTNWEYDNFNNGFIKGAEWVKEKILNQNK